jgi:hypothetical protein
MVSISLMLVISLCQMWKYDLMYARLGGMASRMSGQLAGSLKNIPSDRLVVVWPGDSYLVASGWGEDLIPYSVQRPLVAADLATGLKIIEHPDMSCCGAGEWWQKVGPILNGEFSRPPGDEVTIYLLSWDGTSGSFRQTVRAMPRSLFTSCVTLALGGSPQSADVIGDPESQVVKSLANLVAGDGTAKGCRNSA